MANLHLINTRMFSNAFLIKLSHVTFEIGNITRQQPNAQAKIANAIRNAIKTLCI